MIVLVLIVFGLIWGSFVNAFVWRLHERKDWVRGRSECTSCHHTLASKDLIPVMSWLLLRGKCRYCHKQIEDSPIVELSVPFLFVVSYVWWPWALQAEGLVRFVFWLVFVVCFTILAVYDLRWKLLPNKIVYPLIAIAVAQTLTLSLLYSRNISMIENAAVGALIISGGFYALFQISAGKWIGGGDVKLGMVLGILCGGAWQALLLLFIASLSGTLMAIPLLAKKKLKTRATIPFGPFLLFASFVIELFGTAIIHWYTHLII
jgi:prepilin signal peptidase PulO-like enzyme (type II secretory pathway)